MPTFKGTPFTRILATITLAGALALAGTLARADDGKTKSPFTFHDLERGDVKALTSENPEAARDMVQALEYAASKGDEVAMWRLGRHYSRSEQIENNHLRAFSMFSQVVRQQSDLTPYSPRAPFTAHALLSLGQYYETGIPNSHVNKNINAAWRMYFTAATVYGDARAQFALFTLCDTEFKNACSSKQAARWLKRSAMNGHLDGQVHFGLRQFEGDKGISRNKIEGLKWLNIALERTSRAREAWVLSKHEQVFAVASEKERKVAIERAEKWMRKHCGTIGGGC